ncbi:MAG TPA: YggS family pyridoxal phosphate-dependent enzyme [Armatimonadota bacterium]|jgi:hypothetical protein
MSISENITKVKARIESAAARAGRESGSITLVAVTKTVDASKIREAIDAGITDIGENYMQDAAQKFDILGHAAKWHMIGHLQSRKARQAVEIFDLIQSVDSLSLSQEIGKRSLVLGKTTSVLIEVNISAEESKFGVAPDEVAALSDAVASVDGVKLEGLMGIAPFVDDETSIRRSFARLKTLWDYLPAEHRIWLSMGMTSDFEIAIEEGSNMVRVGTAIFGPRG